MAILQNNTFSQKLTLSNKISYLATQGPEKLKLQIKKCLDCDDSVKMAVNFLLDPLRRIIKLNPESVDSCLYQIILLCLDILSGASSHVEAVEILNINRNIFHFIKSVLELSNHTKIISGSKIPLADVLEVVFSTCNFFSHTMSSNYSFSENFWNEFAAITDNLSKFSWNIAVTINTSGLLTDIVVHFFTCSIRFQCLCVKNDHQKFYNRCLKFYQLKNDSPKCLAVFFFTIWEELLKSCAQFFRHFQTVVPVDYLLNLLLGWFVSCFQLSNIGNCDLYTNLVECKQLFFRILPEESLKSRLPFIETIWDILQRLLSVVHDKNPDITRESIEGWVSILQREFKLSAPENQKLLLKCALLISQWMIALSNEVKTFSSESLTRCEHFLKFLPLVQWALDFFRITHCGYQQGMEEANSLFRGYAICFYCAMKEDNGSLAKTIIMEHIMLFRTQLMFFTPEKQIQHVHYILCNIALKLVQRPDIGVLSSLLKDLLSTILNFTSVQKLENSGIPNAVDVLLKQYSQLSMCYTHIELHSEALSSLSEMLVTVNERNQTELMKKWAQLKVCICSSPVQAHLKRRSIIKHLNLIGHSLNKEQEIQLLRAELSGYRSLRYSSSLEEEIFVTSSELILLSSHDYHRALAVIDHCRATRILNTQSNWNMENLCQLAVDMLADPNVEPRTINSVFRNFYISLGCYELFHEKDKKLKSAIKLSGVSRNAEAPWVKGIPKGDEEPSDNCDIQASLSHVTLVSGSECLQPLDKALVALERMTDSVAWTTGCHLATETVDKTMILNHAFTLSEGFMSAQRMNQSVRSLYQVLEVSLKMGDKDTQHQATCSLIVLLSRLGLPRQALLLSPSMGDLSSPRLKLQCNLACAQAHYFNGDFKIGFELVKHVLYQLEQESFYPKAVGKLLEIEARYLLVRFLSLSATNLPSLQEETRSEQGWEKVEQILKQPLIVIALDTMKICLKLSKSIYGMKDISCFGWMAVTVKPCLERYLLEGALLVGKLYSHLGSLQEPRGILLEYLAVAQEQAAMIMSAQLLVKLAELDCLSGNEENCFVKCQGIHYLLTYNKVHHVSLDCEISDLKNISPFDSPFTNYFRKVLPKIQIEEPPTITAMDTEIFSSPCSSQQPSPKEVNFHDKKCSCERCEYFNADLYILYAMKLKAECLALNGDHTSCYKMLSTINAEFNNLVNSNIHKMNILRVLVGKMAKCLKINSGMFGYVKEQDLRYDFHMKVFYYQLALSISESLMQLGSFREAAVYIDQNLTRMQTTENGRFCVMLPDIYSALIFQKCISKLHLFAFEKGYPFALLFNTCVSRVSDDDLKSLINPKSDSESELLTPKVDSPILNSSPELSKWLRKIVPNAPVKKTMFSGPAGLQVTPVDFCTNAMFNCKSGAKHIPPKEIKLELANNSGNSMNISLLNSINAKDNEISTWKLQNEPLPKLKDSAESDLEVESRIFSMFPFPNNEKTTESDSKISKKSAQMQIHKDLNICDTPKVEKAEGLSQELPKRVLRNRAKPILSANFETLKSARNLRRTRLTQKENVPDQKATEITRCMNDSPEQMRIGDLKPRPKRAATLRSKKLVLTVAKDPTNLVEEPRNFASSSLDLCSLSQELQHIIKDSNDIQVSCIVEDPDMNTCLNPVRRDLKETLIILSRNPPSHLYSRISLLLAMLQNSQESEEETLYTSFHLSQSVGLTLRHQSLLACQKRLNDGCKKQSFAPGLANLSTSDKKRENMLSFQPLVFKAVPNSMRKILEAIPEDWTVVQLCGATVWSRIQNSSYNQTPDLMIGRFCNASTPSLALVTVQDPQLRRNLLKEFADIMDFNKNNSKEVVPKVWWTNRYSMEQRLQNLCLSMENVWLGCWKCLLLGQPTNPEYSKCLQKALQCLLTKTQQLNVQCRDKHMLQCLLDGISWGKLDRAHVSSGLHYLFGVPTSQQGPLLEAVKSLELNTFPVTDRKPLILILDKFLIHLPWENMPFLQGSPVSRIPSLSFLEAHLMFHRSIAADSLFLKGVEGPKTFYLLNPSKDLLTTQKYFQEKLAVVPGWKGVIGEIPTEEQAISALIDYDCYLYIGHGSGRIYFGKESPQNYPCRAAAILMGCSSAKLRAIGSFDPSGIVFQYLIGGCPTVVGNLWDVTDKDIDKFTDFLVETWLQGEAGSRLCLAVAQSREVCKLKYLIGAAPVVYGLPLYKR